MHDYDFDEVADAIGLSAPAFAEKDFHAIRAVRSIMAVKSNSFALTFSGGTCLARAHKLTARMSEDIDMKIGTSDPELRGNALKNKLRDFRNELCEALRSDGFQLDPKDRKQVEVHDQGKLIRINLDYSSQSTMADQLRPHIQIELKVGTLEIAPVKLPVSSFAAQASNNPPEIPEIECVSLLKIASEKLSALLWRVHAQQTGEGTDSVSQDERLVRHIYDLKMMEAHDDVDQQKLTKRAESLICTDARQAGKSFAADPFRACRQTLGYLTDKPEYATQYDEFIKAMVYGSTKPSYEKSLAWVRTLVDQLPKDSSQK